MDVTHCCLVHDCSAQTTEVGPTKSGCSTVVVGAAEVTAGGATVVVVVVVVIGCGSTGSCGPGVT
jgi:hypothetical protein